MSKLNVGDKVKVKERPQYSLSGWTGEVVEVKEDPKDWVIIKADKTGYRMAFAVSEIEKI